MTEPARVVATPGTMKGQPRLDGTQMTVTQLLAQLRGGMSVEEISAEWPLLPVGWSEAIMEWIDGNAVPEINVAAVERILDSVPDVPAASGDELPADHFDRHSRLFDEGRLSIRVKDLSESEMERIQQEVVEKSEDFVAFGTATSPATLASLSPRRRHTGGVSLASSRSQWRTAV